MIKSMKFTILKQSQVNIRLKWTLSLKTIIVYQDKMKEIEIIVMDW